MRASVSSPNSLNTDYTPAQKSALMHVNPSPSVILNADEFDDDENYFYKCSTLVEVTISLEKLEQFLTINFK
ncbi:hypothetical protein Tcan_18970 [Toxocara canis]|uniref:Uncharacterized protein n=1 Tax=Toxocara canis TaxID=6265 RepID=A0A0B2VU21_TOXCA|nr:hypothetical protein Tcan_18970 [Toxocara canis]